MDNKTSFDAFKAPLGASNSEQERIIRLSNDQVTPEFPEESFPPEFIEMLKLRSKKGESIDAIAAYHLSVLTVAIGNSVELIAHDNQWACKANTFSVILEMSGSNKSGKQKVAEKPLYNIEKKLKAKYDAQKLHYEEEWRKYLLANKALDASQKLDKKELLQEFHTQDGIFKPKKPIVRIGSSTTEALMQKLQASPKGILWSRDEFIGLVKELGQYKDGKGSDIETILELHSCQPIKISRAQQDEDIIVDCPFVSLIGGMQPGIVHKLFTGDNLEQGLPQRFSFIFPKLRDEPLLSLDDTRDLEVYKQADELWDNFIQKVHQDNIFECTYGVELRDLSTKLTLNRDSKLLIINWLNEVKRPMMNAQSNDAIRSYAAKLDYLVYKSVLVHHVMWTNFGVGGHCTITENIDTFVVEKALKYVEYLMGMWFKTYRVFLGQTTEQPLKGARLKLYKLLSDSNFTGADAVKIAEENQIMKKTAVYKFLKDKSKVFFSYDEDSKTYIKTGKLDE